MAYYQGDYYIAGDYYQGDPFLGLGTLAGMAFGGLKKLFTKKATTQLAKRTIANIGGGIIAGTAFSRLGMHRTMIPHVGKGIITGVHKRSAYQHVGEALYQEPSATKRAIQRFLPGGKTGLELKQRRRMNVANPLALRRSLRRVAGFGKLCQRSKTDIGRAARSVGAFPSSRKGPVARHHARIRSAA